MENFNETYTSRLGSKYYNMKNSAKFADHVAKLQSAVNNIPFYIETLGDAPYVAALGWSFDPENHQIQQESMYVHHILTLCSNVLEVVNNEEAIEKLKKYAETYRSKLLTYYGSLSRVISPMITGPANFPVRRNEKARAVSQKRLDDIDKWTDYAQKRLKQELGLFKESSVIKSTDENAEEKIKEKIQLLKLDNEIGKECNKILRRKDLTQEAKLEIINRLKQGFTPYNTWYDEVGIPAHRLALNNAEIKRLEGRLIVLARKDAEVVKQAENEGSNRIDFNGGYILDNAEADRVQIFFDNKPDSDVREKLKSNGFRWAPSNGAWQSYRKSYYIDRAKNICGSN